MDLVDRLDGGSRHDTMAILDAANEFSELTDFEQDETEFGCWGYAGLAEAEHPLTTFLRETSQPAYVVRDLDGTLWRLWEESPISGRWSRGRLFREHLVNDEMLDERDEDDPGWVSQKGICLSPAELRELLTGLPGANGFVFQY
jgi:hypothetical protein